MAIEKKTASTTFKSTEETALILKLVARREGKTLSEFLDDMVQSLVEREKEYGISIARELKIENVNDISKGYVISNPNEKKRAMCSRAQQSHVQLAVSN